MRSRRFIQGGFWCACACALFALSCVATGCEQIDPVRTKNLCDGPGPISMRCPQCLTPKLDPRCSMCQHADADPELCQETATSPSKGAGRGGSEQPRGGAGDSSEAGEGGAGAPVVDGGEGQAGESGSGGMSMPAGGQGGAPAAPSGCTGELSCASNDPQHPVCDPISKHCVECTGDQHCPGRVCNLELHRCQNCIVNDDCMSNACDEAAHVCVDCKKDADCQVGDPMRERGSCDTATFTCVDCVNASGCPDPVRGTCDTSTFTCVDCMSEGDCKDPAKPACDANMHVCVPCLNNDDCSDPVLDSCDKPKRTCVDCIDNTGCRIGPNTQCDTEAQKCVECLGDGDCPSKHCLDQECVACKADGHCPTADEARCDPSSHVCVPCTSNANCMHLPQTSVCDTGSGACVECNDDSTCGVNSCIRASHECSNVPRQSLGVCEACQADSMCQATMQCVPLTFGSQSVGTSCVYLRSMRPGRSCTNARPYSRMFSSRSIDSTATSEYCGPPSTTTCQGVLDVSLGASGATCKVDADCGVPGVSDGHCVDASRCTYVCGSEGDDVNCPVGLACLTNGLCG